MRPFRPLARLALGAVLGVVLTAALGAPAQAQAPERVIVVLGDSLAAGLGVAVDEAFPARLQERLRREGYVYRVVNAGVSGDTTAGGLRRADWVLRARPEIVILALGANDGLRGLPISQMKSNLRAIVERLTAGGARVLLAGMRVPSNYGDPYAREYAEAFAEVARRGKTRLMPFLLEGVAAEARLNQPDGIHPNAAGHQVIADHLWPHLKPLLTRRPPLGAEGLRPAAPAAPVPELVARINRAGPGGPVSYDGLVRTLALGLWALAVLTACGTVPDRAYYPDPADPETKAISHALWRAAIAAGDDPHRYSFALIATQDVTAYSTDDAILYVTRGLARQPLRVLEPLVAAQVSHEVLGHRGERRALAVTLSASFTVLGVAVPGLGLLDFLASPLIVRAWTRDQVLAADRKTVEVLGEMGYAAPRRALADALRTAERVNGPPQGGLLAAEPDLNVRLAALEPLEPLAAATPAAR